MAASADILSRNAAVALCVASTGLVFARLSADGGANRVALLALVFAALAFAGLAVAAQRGVRRAGMAVPFVGAFTLTAFSLAEGGLFSDAGPWFPFVSLVAAVLGFARLTYSVTTFVIFLLVVLLVMHISGQGLEAVEPARAVLRFLAIASACGFGAYLAATLKTTYARREARLKGDARTDPLTGLLNRRGLDEVLRRSNVTAMAVFYIDLDGVKHVNDTLGHAAGDAVIVESANRLRRAVRSWDMCARVGGDEFVIVVPGVAEKQLSQVMAERFRAALADEIGLESGDMVTVTGSVGFALSGDDEPLDFDGLIGAADTAMYAAKKRGGDQAVISDVGRAVH